MATDLDTLWLWGDIIEADRPHRARQIRAAKERITLLESLVGVPTPRFGDWREWSVSLGGLCAEAMLRVMLWEMRGGTWRARLLAPLHMLLVLGMSPRQRYHLTKTLAEREGMPAAEFQAEAADLHKVMRP